MWRDVMIFFYISYGALWILVILQSLILLGLVQVVHQLQKPGLTVSALEGKEAPEFSARDLSGVAVTSANFKDHLTGLLFVSTNCQACLETLQDDIEYLYHKVQGNVIVICRAGREDCARLVERYGLTVPMVVDENDQISQLYDISSVPTVVFINADNRIITRGHPKRPELKELLENVTHMTPQEATG